MRWSDILSAPSDTDRMRKLLLLIPIALLAESCGRRHDTPASAYRHFGDRLRAATDGLFGFPCHRGAWDLLSPAECYRMTAPQRMQGVWIDEFEGSRFVTGAHGAASIRLEDGEIWLDIRTHRIPGLFQAGDRTENVRLFEVDFIGRKTLVPGQYGHMGGAEHMIVMERLIAARRVDAGPWIREVDALWGRKEAERAKARADR